MYKKDIDIFKNANTFLTINFTKSYYTGVIHIGAYECEERQGYLKYFNLDKSKII